MLYFYTLKSELKNEEIISAIKNYKAIAIRPELALLRVFISFGFGKAQEDFGKKKNAANAFPIEWLLRIACTRSIKKAIEFCTPDSDAIGVVGERPIPKKILAKIGRRYKTRLNGKMLGEVANQYGISRISLVKYPLEKLLEEKCIVSFLE